MKSVFRKASFFSVPKEELFKFHERKDAFSLLTPASANIEVESIASTLAPSDDVVRFAVKFGPARFRFENVHTVYEPSELFVDEQKKGLFAMWRHEHRFIEAGWEKRPASMLEDEITYAHPLLPAFDLFVRHRLKGLFEYRHRVTSREVHMNTKSKSKMEGEKIAVTGATGLIGKRIVEILAEKGAHVVAFVRDEKKARNILGDNVECIHWDFTRPDLGDWKRALAEADAAIHLAGTPLFKQRWTPAFKKDMEESRVLGTRMLVDAIRASERKPECFVSASAMGIYGMDPSAVVDENSKPADDLLARICVNWESEAKELDDVGVRNVQVRVGIVLSTESGALKEMLPLFRTGLGGTMGSPNHYINWIHIEDVARIFVMAVENDEMSGPYNAVAPNPVKNSEFAKAVARALKRPSLMKFPTAMLKIIIGEAGQYASGGPRAKADKILNAGYRFFFEDIDKALTNLVG
jgi:uncharacterized protein (TIGR01777 family)